MCICSLTITNLRAQSNNASITGEISDPKGAVIQGAQVTLTSKDTKQTSNYVSDGNGFYSFRNVLPGTYQLTVIAAGFGEYTQEGILVRVGYPIRQDVHLKLQATSQSVDVAAVLDEAAGLLAPAAEAAQVDLKAQIDAADTRMDADRDQITQLVLHLGGNAVKFTPPRGRVTLRLSLPGFSNNLSWSCCRET